MEGENIELQTREPGREANMLDESYTPTKNKGKAPVRERDEPSTERCITTITPDAEEHAERSGDDLPSRSVSEYSHSEPEGSGHARDSGSKEAPETTSRRGTESASPTGTVNSAPHPDEPPRQLSVDMKSATLVSSMETVGTANSGSPGRNELQASADIGAALPPGVTGRPSPTKPATPPAGEGTRSLRSATSAREENRRPSSPSSAWGPPPMLGHLPSDKEERRLPRPDSIASKERRPFRSHSTAREEGRPSHSSPKPPSRPPSLLLSEQEGCSYLRQLCAVEVRHLKHDLGPGNVDTFPVADPFRNWGWWQFSIFWIMTSSFTVTTWTSGPLLMTLGLEFWEALPIIYCVNLFVGIICFFTGWPGRQSHINFPITQRACWGMRGHYFVVLHHFLLSPLWMGVQIYSGAQCFALLVRALDPHPRYLNDTPIGLYNLSRLDMFGLVFFVVFCALFTTLRPELFKAPFLVAAVITVPCILLILVPFAVHREDSKSWTQPLAGGAHTSKLWQGITGVGTILKTAGMSALVQSNFTRFARDSRSKRALVIAQVVVTPVFSTIVALFGIFCMDSAHQRGLLSEPPQRPLVEPWRLLQEFTLQHHIMPPSYRGVAFIGGLGFTISQLCLVIPSLGVSAGLDLASALPRWFTIPGGTRVALSLATMVALFVPFDAKSANLDLVFKGWPTFMAPYIGIFMVDYFAVRRRKYATLHLYRTGDKNNSTNNPYWYTHGVNLRAVVAYLVPLAILLPGFVGSIRSKGKEPQQPLWRDLELLTQTSPAFGAALGAVLYAGMNIRQLLCGDRELAAGEIEAPLEVERDAEDIKYPGSGRLGTWIRDGPRRVRGRSRQLGDSLVECFLEMM